MKIFRENEARALGVGYFAFARDENVRHKQMETLNMLRDQTEDQRVKRERLKAKRKATLEARLSKLKQRKQKNLKGAEAEDETVPAEEEELIGPQLPEPKEMAGPNKAVEVIVQERKDTKSGAPHVREWDRGKEFTFGHWSKPRTDPRDERDPEFAPPSFYAEHKKSTGHHSQPWNQTRSSNEKPKLFFKQNPCPQEQPGFSSDENNLDEMLSYYRNLT
ncbi:hypothetical protein GDO86_007114 [Hymenochirus boettgeri]|uniref:Coiled-coil domain-containing protein 174 n=1 Tax=Hymenochirus boettgeri TaxID=247094 RepID=A0A8T2ISI2_9PIPI|nr:hypothetical protein GDO86_007114 [Hymenochirus boettgeri]